MEIFLFINHPLKTIAGSVTKTFLMLIKLEINIIKTTAKETPSTTCHGKKNPLKALAPPETFLKKIEVNPIPIAKPIDPTTAACVKTIFKILLLVTPIAFKAANCFKFSTIKI